MKINQSYSGILFLLLLAGGVSCTANFEEFNKNPFQPDNSEMQYDGYITTSALKGMQAMLMPEAEGISQYVDCLMGGSWGGYSADTNPGTGWGGRYATYNPSQAWINIPFNDPISQFYPFYLQLQSVTDDEILLAVGDICRVGVMQRVTDTYGPIPYSQVGEAHTLNSPYDSQEEVYSQMFKELDRAIEVLSSHTSESFSANADAIYGGDITKWVQFANSLKLRLAMRIVYADPVQAQQRAEEAVSDPIGVIRSNSDNARRSISKTNPWDFFMNQWGDARASADIVTYMNGYEDPRREFYFTKSTFDEKTTGITNDYYGVRNGIEQQRYLNSKETMNCYSKMLVHASDPIYIMNAAEVAFLRAEGALRGWNMGDDAQTLYEQGITLSFEQWGAGGASEYLKDDQHTQQAYADPLGNYSYEGTPATCTIAWEPGEEHFERNLERIITQKWIANYPLGVESWSEYRRTGYPRLMPVPHNMSGGVVDDREGARRMPYPDTEYTENAENYIKAVQMLGGQDNMATHVWWDKKNNQ